VPRTALDAAIYGLGLLVDGRLEADITRYSSETELIVFPAPNSGHVPPTSFEHSSRLISEALTAARTLLVHHDVTAKHLRLANQTPKTGVLARAC
jgi:hypothetical protein